MRPIHASRIAPVVAVILASAVPPVAVLVAGTGIMVMPPLWFHVAVVGTAGTLAAAAAIALSARAARSHDGRGVLLGTGFAAIALILVVHALATPGVLVGPNNLVGLASGLSLPVGAGILALSALPVLRRPTGVQRLVRVQVAVLAGLAVLGAVALLVPSIVPPAPGTDNPLRWAVIGFEALCFAMLAWRAGNTWLLTRRRSDLLVLGGLSSLAVAQYGLLALSVMDLGWWLAHLLEVTGIGLLGAVTALDLHRGASSRPLVGDLRAGELVARQEVFLGARVRALMARLAEKDPYTEGHTRRVAAYAVAMGEELGLPPARLRLLALGGLLHDIGKLSVPDAILNKPGKLTDEEYAAIRRHPDAGRRLLIELGGFPDLVLRLVAAHHERLDGKGYPYGEDARMLELEVRILTVADVYDALVSTRVYREAWPSARALALLGDERGLAFEPRCIVALERVLAGSFQATTEPLAQPAAPRPRVAR